MSNIKIKEENLKKLWDILIYQIGISPEQQEFVKIWKKIRFRVIKGINQKFLHISIIFNKRSGLCLSCGMNKYLEFKDFYDDKKSTSHGEPEAIFNKTQKKPKSKLRGKNVLVSLRLSKNGHLGPSLACKSCAKILSKNRNSPEEFIYMNEDKKFIKIETQHLIKHPKVRYSSCQRSRKERSCN